MSRSTANYTLLLVMLISPRTTTMTLNPIPTKTIPNTNTKTTQGASSVTTMEEVPRLHHRHVEVAEGAEGTMGGADCCPTGSRT